MNFGQALELCKAGAKICREGWNGKGMHVFIGTPHHIAVRVPENDEGVASKDARQVFGCEYQGDVLCMKTAQDTIQVGWLATQSDMLANDWVAFGYTESK